tara:strand:+ start:800 stop:1090 length:291 start_codon:yes stop_codon:yes gene_type:complete
MTKKEEVVDLKPKAEKITKEQLEKVQKLINDINKSQIEIGQVETRKHALLHHISALQEGVGELRKEFEKDYGTSDINIQDGIINYPKENGEVNKED